MFSPILSRIGQILNGFNVTRVLGPFIKTFRYIGKDNKAYFARNLIEKMFVYISACAQAGPRAPAINVSSKYGNWREKFRVAYLRHPYR